MIQDGPGELDEVVVTDTLPLGADKHWDRLTILPIAPLLARATVFADEVAQSVSIGEAQHAVSAGLVAAETIVPLGAVLTGVFASPDLGGTGVWDYVTNQVAEGYSILTQVKIQVIGVLVTVAWTALVSAVAYKLVDLLIGLRVKEDAEREGLDVTTHGEKAYSL